MLGPHSAIRVLPSYVAEAHIEISYGVHVQKSLKANDFCKKFVLFLKTAPRHAVTVRVFTSEPFFRV